MLKEVYYEIICTRYNNAVFFPCNVFGCTESFFIARDSVVQRGQRHRSLCFSAAVIGFQ